jgi:RNA polymerase sigma factor (sigma-70 family)
MADVPTSSEPWVEPGLDGALDHLSGPQRTAVVLIHGFGWTYQEVSELLAVRRSTVQRHAARALSKLRSELEVRDAIA